ncbi:MAG: hypothetical protein ACI4US_05850 [Muribaculaceae bacterium]
MVYYNRVSARRQIHVTKLAFNIRNKHFFIEFFLKLSSALFNSINYSAIDPSPQYTKITSAQSRQFGALSAQLRDKKRRGRELLGSGGWEAEGGEGLVEAGEGVGVEGE